MFLNAFVFSVVGSHLKIGCSGFHCVWPLQYFLLFLPSSVPPLISLLSYIDTSLFIVGDTMTTNVLPASDQVHIRFHTSVRKWLLSLLFMNLCFTTTYTLWCVCHICTWWPKVFRWKMLLCLAHTDIVKGFSVWKYIFYMLCISHRDMCYIDSIRVYRSWLLHLLTVGLTVSFTGLRHYLLLYDTECQ